MRTTHHRCERQEAPWLLSQVHLKSLKLTTRAQDPPWGRDYCPSKVRSGVCGSAVSRMAVSTQGHRGLFSAHIWPSGWWNEAKSHHGWEGTPHDGSGSPEEALSDLEELAREIMGGYLSHTASQHFIVGRGCQAVPLASWGELAGGRGMSTSCV